MFTFTLTGRITRYVKIPYGLGMIVTDVQTGYTRNGIRQGDRCCKWFVVTQNSKQADTIKNTFQLNSLVQILGSGEVNAIDNEDLDMNDDELVGKVMKKAPTFYKFKIHYINFFNTINPYEDKKLEKYNDKLLGNNAPIDTCGDDF